MERAVNSSGNPPQVRILYSPPQFKAREQAGCCDCLLNSKGWDQNPGASPFHFQHAETLCKTGRRIVMATSKTTITRWFNEACNRKASNLIIATDTFDYDDYPVFVMPEEDARKVVERIRSSSMQEVTEVYSCYMPLEPQLAQDRVFNYEPK